MNCKEKIQAHKSFGLLYNANALTNRANSSTNKAKDTTSHSDALTSHIQTMNKGYNHTAITQRVHRSDLSDLGKALAERKKNGQTVSAEELNLLASMPETIKKQGSHQESKKLASQIKLMKIALSIESPESKASKAMSKNFAIIAEAKSSLHDLEKKYTEGMKALNEKLTKIDTKSQGTGHFSTAKQKCIAENSAQRKFNIANNMANNLRGPKETVTKRSEGRWNRTQYITSEVETHKKGFDSWFNCAVEAKKLIPIEKKIAAEKKRLTTSINENKFIVDRYNISNDDSGLDKLRSMNASMNATYL
ncbi:TPA: hypothetical protein ACH1J3_004846 [Citrobacter werkmanii]